jgi:hypothetical protein
MRLDLVVSMIPKDVGAEKDLDLQLENRLSENTPKDHCKSPTFPSIFFPNFLKN